MLAPIAGPVSWASGVASKMAGYLGWSKPRTDEAPMLVSTQFNHFMPNANGADISYELALMSDNSVLVTDQNGLTDFDEMSFDYLKQVATITRTLNWTTANTTGTSLFHELCSPAHPNAYISGTTTHTLTATHYSGGPMYYLSRFFRLWRGSMRLTLKIAKTDFHSGRIAIMWTPTQTLLTAPVYNGSAQYALRYIVDIREGSEITLDLPYLLGSNYAALGAGTSPVPSGQLDITVINILRAPETCANNVDILMYWSAAPDMEYAAPGPAHYQPFVPQIGEIVFEEIGGGPEKMQTTKYAESSIGEKFSSILQLLKRPTSIVRSIADAAAAGWYLYPWFVTIASHNATTGALIPPILGGDMYCQLAPLFMFAKGSVRILNSVNGTEAMYVTNVPNASAVVYYGANTGILPAVTATLGAAGTTPVSNIPVAVQEPGTKLISAEMPYYCPTKFHINDLNYSGTTTMLLSNSKPTSIYGFAQTGNTANYVWRSVGEDFQFSYFVGCPPVLVSIA